MAKKKTVKKSGKSVGTSAGSTRVRQYTWASAFDAQEMARQVNKYIGQGWQPLGGISVAVRHDPNVQVLWSQALVR